MTNQLILTAESCWELKTEVEAITQWTHSRSRSQFEYPPVYNINCFYSPNLRQIDITPIVSAQVLSSSGKKSASHGPNCFNNSLLDVGLLDSRRYVDRVEFDYYLQHHCQVRSAFEVPLPGDLGVIKKRLENGSSESLHGFIYIRNLVWNKNGLSAAHLDQFEPLESVFSKFQLDEIQMCNNPHPTALRQCPIYARYYSCSNLAPLRGFKALQDASAHISSATLNRDFSKLQQYRNSLAEAERFLKEASLRTELVDRTLVSLNDQFEELLFEWQLERITPTLALKSGIEKVKNIIDQSLLFASVQRNLLSNVINLLRNEKMDPNEIARDEEGEEHNLLTLAIKNRNADILRVLLNHPKIDTSLLNLDDLEESLLGLAYQSKNSEIIAIVIDHLLKNKETVANEFIADEEGNEHTLLTLAIKDQHVHAVKILLNHPEIDATFIPDEMGLSPLELAYRTKNREIINLLLNHLKSRNGQ